MISDNLIYTAMFVFAIMFIGLVLTIIEFHYGEPKRQEEQAKKNPKAAGGDKPVP
jgi:phosphotransferase system  glucose/maltose/N-acetylglucosamine-specific IIC component